MKKLMFTLFLTSVVTLHAQIPASLTGNWINTTTNEWDYGFFEDFAVYDSDFRDYISVQTKKNKTYITFNHDGENLALEIEQKNDSVISIKKQREKKPLQYMLARLPLPAYKTKDTQMFAKPDYTSDSVTIVGYYRNFDKIPEEFLGQYGKNSLRINVPDFLRDEEQPYLTTIDSLGRFSISFPVLNTQECWTDWGRLTKVLIFEPGDKVFLFADVLDLIPHENDRSWETYQNRNKQILFMGENARVNNELVRYKVASVSANFSDAEEKGLGDMEYLRHCENVYNQRISHLNDYISRNPSTSEKFRYFQAMSEKYDFARNLMQHYFTMRGKGQNIFEDGYIEYVQKNFPLDNEYVYTMLREFKGFLNDYTGYVAYSSTGGRVTFSLSPDSTFSVMRKRNLSNDEYEGWLSSFNMLVKQYQAATDSVSQSKIGKQLQEAGNKLSSIPALRDIQDELAMNYFFTASLQQADSLFSNPNLRELWDASLICKLFKEKGVPLTAKMMEQYNERINMPYLRQIIDSQNDYYTDIQQKEMVGEESLKEWNDNNMQAISNPEQMVEELFRPYAGKVIYVDFWGTWCGPCREQMPYSKVLKEEYKDKDLIFMYLANSSPEQSWRNVIKQMELTGKNVVHYRLPEKMQAIVESYMSVKSWPTYVLIDKKGNVVNKDAPKPERKREIMREIDGLLSE